MIAFASLVLAQIAVVGSQPPVVPLVYDSVETVAERMRSITAIVGKNQPGSWTCSLTASSGRGWIDQRLCQVTARCTIRYGDDREDIEPCVERGRKGILKEYRRALRGRA